MTDLLLFGYKARFYGKPAETVHKEKEEKKKILSQKPHRYAYCMYCVNLNKWFLKNTI